MVIKYKWEIGYMDYVYKPDPIISPPFHIEPSRTFAFCLQLHPFGRDPLYDDMVLVLWRCDSNERSIELTYELEIDPYIGAYLVNPVINERFTYNFKTPMQFPESRVYLLKHVSECESVLRITCTILNHDIFQDVDEDVMAELSSQYELLLNGNVFSDYRVQVENRYFNVHNAILKVRCIELAREINILQNIDPTISRSILRFLYSGKLTTWTANVIQVLMPFRNSLLKTMYPFIISEYSAKTSFVGKCYSFEWEIKDLMPVKPENVFTYLIKEGGAVMQVSFFPYRENDVSNFSIEVFESEDCFIRCKVDILQQDNSFFNLVDMTNSKINISSLEVKRFYSIDWVRKNYPNLIKNDAIKLKIYIYMCSFNARCASNINAINYTNVSNNTTHMYNLMEDFKKLFHHSLYYDSVITVKYERFHEDYERYFANNERFCEDYERYFANYERFNTDYARIQTHFMRFNEHYARFFVHKAILSARSSVFRSILSHRFFQTQNNFEIFNVNPYVLYNMLLFMYCGQLSNLNLELAFDLNSAADKYDIKTLKIKCSKFLESIIRVDNVEKIRKHACTHSIESLERACYWFRRRNFNIIG